MDIIMRYINLFSIILLSAIILIIQPVLFLGIITVGILIPLLFSNTVWSLLPLIVIYFNTAFGNEIIILPIRDIILILTLLGQFFSKKKIRLLFNKGIFHYILLIIYLLMQILLFKNSSFYWLKEMLYNFISMYICIIAINTKKDLHIFIKILLVSASLQAIIGLVELFIGQTFYYSRWAGVRFRNGIFRIGSTAADPNYLCYYLIPLISLSIYMFKKSKNNFKRCIYAVITLLLVIVSFITMSRIGWISLIVIVLIFGIYKIEKYKIFSILSKIIGIVILIATISVVFIINEDKGSNSLRTNTLFAAIEIFKQNFLFGIGLGSFPFKSISIINNMFDIGLNYTVTTMNFYIQILSEAGIIGIFLVFNIIICSYKIIKFHLNNNTEFYELSRCVIVSLITWLLISFTLDGIFYPPFWLITFLPLIVDKVYMKNRKGEL